MLHVRIDLVPGGVGAPRTIHELFIANITPGSNPADYAVWVDDPRGREDETLDPAAYGADVIVKNHVRQDGAPRLVERAIGALGQLKLLAGTRRD